VRSRRRLPPSQRFRTVSGGRIHRNSSCAHHIEVQWVLSLLELMRLSYFLSVGLFLDFISSSCASCHHLVCSGFICLQAMHIWCKGGQGLSARGREKGDEDQVRTGGMRYYYEVTSLFGLPINS